MRPHENRGSRPGVGRPVLPIPYRKIATEVNDEFGYGVPAAVGLG